METQTRAVELAAYQAELDEHARKFEDMVSLVGRLERQREAQLLASAEALIVGEPFDLSVVRELEDRLAQAERAAKILETRYVVFKRNGPSLTHDLPPLHPRFFP